MFGVHGRFWYLCVSLDASVALLWCEGAQMLQNFQDVGSRVQVTGEVLSVGSEGFCYFHVLLTYVKGA